MTRLTTLFVVCLAIVPCTPAFRSIKTHVHSSTALDKALEGSSSVEAIYDRLMTSPNRDNHLPVQLQGRNLTLDNLRKWFTLDPEPIDELVEETAWVPDTMDGYSNKEEQNITVQSNVDDIINVGKHVWDVIKDNKPEYNVNRDFATATPKGVSWNKMAGWVQKTSATFFRSWKNKFGSEACRYEWKYTYGCGGQYRGKGRYLAQVTTQTVRHRASWPNSLSVKVKAQKPLNLCSSSFPVASIRLQAEVICKSQFSSVSSAQNVIIRGTCGACDPDKGRCGRPSCPKR